MEGETVEIFVDFGFFELVAALGVAAMARVVYSRKAPGLVFLAVSIVAPVAMLVETRGSAAVWLAAACVTTSLVNGAVVFGAVQRGEARGLTLPMWKQGP